MAMFSDDLFNVFEESSQPKEPKVKKRFREGKEAKADDSKRVKVKTADSAEKPHKDDEGSRPVTSNLDAEEESMESSQEQEEVALHMGYRPPPPLVQKKPQLFSESAQIVPVDTLEGLLCTHEEYPFVLDPFQKEAIRCIENYKSVLVSAHTSAGKTAVAEYAIALSLKDTQRVIYTTPIKALSNQKYREMQEMFKDVGLMTGDVTINPSASCIVMTTEVMREVGWVIFDEIHYMRDPERGVVWEETIILLPDNVHYVFLSATIPNARQFAEWICHLHKQPCHVVYTEFRPTPLQHYIYPNGADGLYLVKDEKDNFRDDNFQLAMSKLQGGGGGGRDPIGRGKKAGQRGSNMFRSDTSVLDV